MATETPCMRLAAALHAACVELEAAREDHTQANSEPGVAPPWLDKVGRHVALAIAALPDSVLRAWLLDPHVVGGEQIYKTLKAGAGIRAEGRPK